MGKALSMHRGDNKYTQRFGGEVKKMEHSRTHSMNR